MNAPSTVHDYIALGWSPVPIPRGEKGPRIKGWNKLRIDARNVGAYFNGSKKNIGIILGSASGELVDVDLDAHEACELAPLVLPATGAVFGRDGKPSSHWLYRCPGAKSARLAHGSDTLCELRAAGGQTVFPSSVHPSGEPIRWERWGEPALVSHEELAAAVHLLAEATKLKRAGVSSSEAVLKAKTRRAVEPAERPSKPRDGAFSEAVERYNREHPQEWPRSAGECPMCGHKGCFGRMPDVDGRWYCFSSAHTDGGIRGQHGHHGDALDIDAHRMGMSRFEVLRSGNYLESRPAPVKLPPKPTKARGRKLKSFRLEDLTPPKGWRENIDERTVKALVESIPREGLREPLVVIPTGHIVHGVHRWAAAGVLKLSELECIVESPSSTADEHEAKVIAENLARRHLKGAERDAMLTRLTELRGEADCSDRPRDANPSFVVQSVHKSEEPKPASFPRGGGRKKAPKTKAREQVAKRAGTTPAAVRQAEIRARKREEPPKPPKPKAPEHIPESRRADWELIEGMTVEVEDLLRRAQSRITRTIKKAGQDTPAGTWAHSLAADWRRRLHDVAHEMRARRPVCACLWCRGEGGSAQCPCRGLGLISQDMLDRAPPELRGEAPTVSTIMGEL